MGARSEFEHVGDRYDRHRRQDQRQARHPNERGSESGEAADHRTDEKRGETTEQHFRRHVRRCTHDQLRQAIQHSPCLEENGRRMRPTPEAPVEGPRWNAMGGDAGLGRRSEEHTSELQSLMRNSYDVFCLKKKMTITYKG